MPVDHSFDTAVARQALHHTDKSVYGDSIPSRSCVVAAAVAGVVVVVQAVFRRGAGAAAAAAGAAVGSGDYSAHTEQQQHLGRTRRFVDFGRTDAEDAADFAAAHVDDCLVVVTVQRTTNLLRIDAEMAGIDPLIGSEMLVRVEHPPLILAERELLDWRSTLEQDRIPAGVVAPTMLAVVEAELAVGSGRVLAAVDLD